VTTRKEHQAQIAHEQNLLDKAWEETFYSGTPQEGRALFLQHHVHPPVAIARLLDELFEEVVDRIMAEAANRVAKGDLDQENVGDAIFSGTIHMARTTAIRMFLLGQQVKDKLPFDKFTSCGCSTLFDDEVGDLFTVADLLKEEGGET
jgi:hypothetical protein